MPYIIAPKNKTCKNYNT